MNINIKQSQFELFPHTQHDAPASPKPRFFLSSITLSFENIIILTVCLFVVMILSFSVGVERGRKVATRSAAEPQAVASVKPQVVVEPEVVPQPETVLPAQIPTVVQAVEKPYPAEQDILGFSGEKYFTVQVASFKTKKYAQKEAEALKQKGYDSFIFPKGSHIIVCAGRFQTRQEAVGFSNQLKNQYKDCFARRL